MLTLTERQTTRSAYTANAWHLRAVRLPDGDRPEDWWIADGQLVDHPVEGARDLPGGWVLPGLVDAHAHLTMDFNNTGLRGATLVDANLQTQMKAGVLAVRDMGTVPDAMNLNPHPLDKPRVIPASSFFAPADGFHPGLYRAIEAGHLIEEALEAVANGAAWVKVIADFPGPDGNWWRPRVNYSAEVLHALVEAVHAKGAKVAVHVTGPFASECVRAGVDSIEHGPGLTADDLAEMARRGTVWTPTLAVATRYAGMAAGGSGPVAEAARENLKQLRQMIPLAARLGLTILTGTDELPHGALAKEVAKLDEYGLPVTAALAAASTKARSYLGLPGFEAGALADFVLFSADPRVKLEALAQPAAVILRGRKIV